jgi:Flp pilus assembly protein TadG
VSARRHDGQAAVELALALPVVVLFLLLVVQAGLVIVDQVAVVEAARDGARAAALDPAPGAARGAVLHGRFTPVRTEVVEQRVAGHPGTVTIEVTHRAPTDVPLVGPLLPDVELHGAATMAVESP